MDQEQRIAALEAKVLALTQLLQQSKRPNDDAVPEEDPTTSRRGMLKLAGAAAVGAVAATVGGAGLAAADNGLTLTLGSNTTSSVPTKVLYTGTDNTISAFVFDTFGYAGNTSFYPASLAGWTGSAANKPASGVYGYTVNAAGFGSSATTPAVVPV